MAIVNSCLSIITVNILNSPIKRHRMAEWIRKQDPKICCLKETPFNHKDTHKQKEWKKTLQANGNPPTPHKKSRGSYTYIRQNGL